MDSPNPYQPPQEREADPIRLERQLDPMGNLPSRWLRLAASLLDGVTMLIATFVPMWYLGLWDLDRAATLQEEAVSAALHALAFAIVNIHLLATRGQTVGKLVCRIRIMGSDGRPAGLWRILLRRELPFFIVGGFQKLALLLLVDVLFIFRRDRRCVHDLLADTIVVHAR